MSSVGSSGAAARTPTIGSGAGSDALGRLQLVSLASKRCLADPHTKETKETKDFVLHRGAPPPQFRLLTDRQSWRTYIVPFSERLNILTVICQKSQTFGSGLLCRSCPQLATGLRTNALRFEDKPRSGKGAHRQTLDRWCMNRVIQVFNTCS